MSDVNDWNKQIIAEFRANDGVVGGMFEGITLLILHTKGAKSGLPRENPVVCMEDGDRLFVAASKAGAPSNPDWYYNLVANPDIVVELGTQKFPAQAQVADEPERTRLYDKMATTHPQFAEYQEKTERVIPIVTLTRT